MGNFDEKYGFGKVAEGLIAQWLMARGNSVLPVYEIERSRGKGPQLFSRDAEHVAPDMVTFTAKGVKWVEAKHKSVFTWHRGTRQWTTGIDLRHYGDYMHVAKQTNLPVWLMLFHRDSVPTESDRSHGCQAECPTGLFGGELFGLVIRENHRSPPLDVTREGCVGHGRSGMVYWAHKDLRQLATRDEVFEISAARKAANA